MKFGATADHYDRFMGRYTTSLAVAMADALAWRRGPRSRRGMRPRRADARIGGAGRSQTSRRSIPPRSSPRPAGTAAGRRRARRRRRRLPWDDATFDTALSSLVIAFMRDPDKGVREMARVTRPGGTVAACMWDIEPGRDDDAATFWTAMRVFGPRRDERRRTGTRGRHRTALRRAGLEDVEESALIARADYTGFDDFWEPFTYGVGPAGRSRLLAPSRSRRPCARDAGSLPDGPFTLDARAWFARGAVPG